MVNVNSRGKQEKNQGRDADIQLENQLFEIQAIHDFINGAIRGFLI